MATLYRKYRPQNYKEVVGQKPIKTTLENQITSDNFSHAYLFCGSRAVGKTTLARVFAKSVNCLNRKKGESEPCNQCESCQEITAGRSLDILEIDAASHTGVDNVRENIIANSRIAPSRRKYKVFIIDEVHMLSPSAFNALLKTLEEPPANVVFILCTTEVHKMPETIISRCQRFDFKKIGVGEIADKLKYITEQEGIEAEKNILEAIARHSEGHMRDAESLLGQIVAISGKNITQKEADLVLPRSDITEIVNLIEILSRKDAAGGIRLVNKLVEEGVDLKAFVSDLIEILRKVMVSKISPSLGEKMGLDLGESLEMKLNEVSDELNLEQLVSFLNKFLNVRNAVRSSFIIQLPLELAVVELCSEEKTEPPRKSGGGTPRGGNSFGVEEKKRPATPPQGVDKSGKVENILSRWNEVLAKVKKYNHSLSFILKVCKPYEIKDGKLCLAFKYKFHKDRLEDGNIRNLVEKTLKEVFSEDMPIETIVDEKLEIANGNGNNNGHYDVHDSVHDTPNPSAPSASSPRQSSGQAGQAGQKAGQDASGASNKDEQKKEDKKDGKKDDEVIDNILKTFGGKVIN